MQKVFGVCAAHVRTKVDEPMQTTKIEHERVWKDVFNEFSHSKRRGFLTDVRESGKLKSEKEGSPRKGCKRLREEFEVRSSIGTNRFVERRQKGNA